MTPLSRLRGEWKKAKETGGKAPSYLVAVCRATIQALGEFPRVNATVGDDEDRASRGMFATPWLATRAHSSAARG